MRHGHGQEPREPDGAADGGETDGDAMHEDLLKRCGAVLVSCKPSPPHGIESKVPETCG